MTDEEHKAAAVVTDEAARVAGGLTDEAARVAIDLKRYRRFTIVYSVLASGAVALLMAYFISNELSKGVEANQRRIERTQTELAIAQTRSTEELIEACVRGGINRAEKFNYAIFTEQNSIYMASQESDPEIRTGWLEAKKYAVQRQADLLGEANRVGFRLPGTVMNDCKLVVATP